MSTALVALVLLPMALTLVVGLSFLIAQPLLRPALSAIERARLRRAVARVSRGDSALRARQVEIALREYEAGFCLMIVRADPKVADEVNRHHVGLLSRLLAVADGSPQPRVRLLALAKVDRLLDRRAEMQRAHLQLRNRSLRDGRRIQLERELRRNARQARAAVRELIADIQVLTARKVAYQ
jgi:hypothetical protein